MSDRRSRPSEFRITEYLDVFDARRAARLLSVSMEFSNVASHEVAIIVSELGTNIVKHGNGGRITLAVVDEGAQNPGIEMIAEDRGPHLRALETALRDGCDDRGPIDPVLLWKRPGIGAGLGAISRLADDVSYTRLEVGNRFLVKRFRRRNR